MSTQMWAVDWHTQVRNGTESETLTEQKTFAGKTGGRGQREEWHHEITT